MSKIEWDKTSERFFETGIDRGVLYVYDPDTKKYKNGVAWNGLTTVNETPSGAEPNPQYADNIKYLNLYSAEELGVTIEAFTYPDKFAECDGSVNIESGLMIGQQARKMFGLSYRTKVGSDTKGNDAGYKIHLLYGCMASPSERSYSTINDSPEATTFSWELSTNPVLVEGRQPTALITIDSRTYNSTKLKKLEDLLYGTDEKDPELPLPSEIIALQEF